MVAGEETGRDLAPEGCDVLLDEPDQQQELHQGIAGKPLGTFDVALELGPVATGEPLDQGMAELGLGPEMVEERPLGHPGGGNHLIDRAGRKAAAEHQSLGGVQNGAFGLCSVLSQPSLLVTSGYEQTI